MLKKENKYAHDLTRRKGGPIYIATKNNGYTKYCVKSMMI